MIKFIKILSIIIFVFFLPVFFSGCKDSKDINEKTIFTAIAFDKINDQIILFGEIANISAGNQNEGNSGGSKYIQVKSEGKTIVEAIDNMYRQLDKQPYLSAVRTLILTEKFAKDHIAEYLFRIRADELFRKKIMTVITKDNPEEIFKINNEKDISVGFSIEELLMNLENVGQSFTRTTTRIIENLSDKYTGILLPCIGLKNNVNSLIGYSILNGTTISGFIPVQESNGIVYIKTKKAEFMYTVSYKDTKFTIETTVNKCKIKPTYTKEKINFDLEFSFDAELMYGNKKTPYNFDENAKEKVTKDITDLIKKEITSAVEKSQREFKCDYFQFDDEFRVKYPEEFVKINWQNEYTKASINIEVKVDLSANAMLDYETDKRR